MLHYAMCDPNYCADGCCDLYEVVKSVVTPLQSEDKTSLPTVFLSLTVTGCHGGCEDQQTHKCSDKNYQHTAQQTKV